METVVYVKAPEDGFCPQCVNTKRFLTTSGVVFEERVIDKERTMLRERWFTMAPAVEVTGVTLDMFEGVPGVIEVKGGVSWCGLVPPALERLKTLRERDKEGTIPVETVPA